ncbi:hypothetical protein OH736_35500 [Streptomyces sp. NBC_01650]|uniref:hypothetical protein n=1 Tax=Streptomyces sp. NBC_01650 TaxID=2975907 RepID=UPI0038685477|nr:hypothetical protein OH736_35500 [Streptomyces sp. NBC_01650]
MQRTSRPERRTEGSRVREAAGAVGPLHPPPAANTAIGRRAAQHPPLGLDGEPSEVGQ